MLGAGFLVFTSLRGEVSYCPGQKMPLPGEQTSRRWIGSANQQQKWSPEKQFLQQPSTEDAHPLPSLPFPNKNATCIKSGSRMHIPGSSEHNVIYYYTETRKNI